MKMFTGARRKKKKREMDWQLVACYFTVKSTDIFAMHGARTQEETASQTDSYFVILSSETYVFEDKMTMY